MKTERKLGKDLVEGDVIVKTYEMSLQREPNSGLLVYGHHIRAVPLEDIEYEVAAPPRSRRERLETALGKHNAMLGVDGFSARACKDILIEDIEAELDAET